MNIEIGKIVEIKNMQILVDIFDSIETSFKIINKNIIKIGGVNNFIKAGDLIYQINLEKIENINTKNSDSNKVIPIRTLVCDLIGYFDEQRNYKIGACGDLPYLFQTVETLTYDELQKIYSNTCNFDDAICVGKYVFEKKLSAFLDINKFFASHILLVGNTGSGKSNTLASMYTKLFEKTNYDFSKSKFLIIDTNGEYSKCFSKNKTIRKLDLRTKNGNNLKIPINLITIEDWQILTGAAEKTQLPLLKSVIDNVTYNIYENKNDITDYIHRQVKELLNNIITNSQRGTQKVAAILSIRDLLKNYDLYNNSRNSCSNFDLYLGFCQNISVNNDRLVFTDSNNQFIDQTNKIKTEIFKITHINVSIVEFGIDELILLLEMEEIKRINSFGLTESHLAPFIARVKGNAIKFKKIFTPYQNETKESTDLEKLLFEDKNICVCDVSLAGKEMRRIMVSFTLDKLHRNAISNRENVADGEHGTYHFIIDEAHNYLSPNSEDKKDMIYESCLETIETIIKEGRKFGVFLTIATQRPSDISSAILSQCHNYIIHKLVNPKDILIIENSIPFLDEMSTKMLTVLSAGQAIFSGTALNKANIVYVDMPSENYEVNSKTPDLTTLWKKN